MAIDCFVKKFLGNDCDVRVTGQLSRTDPIASQYGTILMIHGVSNDKIRKPVKNTNKHTNKNTIKAPENARTINRKREKFYDRRTVKPFAIVSKTKHQRFRHL